MIVARLKSDQAGKTNTILANGHYRNTPVEISLLLPTWESIRDAHRQADLVPMSLDLSVPYTTASLTFSVSPAWPPRRADVRFTMKSEAPAQSAALVGLDLPAIKPLTLRCTLFKEGDTWKMSNCESQIGNSLLRGKGVVKVGTPVWVKAQLASSHLDLAEWMTVLGEVQPTQTETKPSSSIRAKDRSTNDPRPQTSLAPWVKEVDGYVGITVQKLVLPTLSLKKISAGISVVDAQLKFESSLGNLGKGRIQTAGSLDLTHSSPTGRLKANIEQVNLTPLMRTVGNNEMQLGKLSGQIALRLPPGSHAHDTNNDKTILDRVRIEAVRLQYDDPLLQAKTDLRLMTDSFDSEMKIEGTVEYQGIPVDVSLTTGSLRQGIENYQALPIDANLKIRDHHGRDRG